MIESNGVDCYDSVSICCLKKRLDLPVTAPDLEQDHV